MERCAAPCPLWQPEMGARTGATAAAPVDPRGVASRQPLLIFLAVLLLLSGQLAWWMYFHIRSVNDHYRLQLSLLRRQQSWAAALPTAAGMPPAELLQRHFPELRWEPGRGAVIRPEIALAWDGRRRHLIRMFLAEGAFFWLMVGLGATLIVRALRQHHALSAQQNNFLSAVTHELKSPLAAIRLQTQTLQLRDPPAPTRQRYLGAIQQDLDRLETLVGNLLAVARLEAGRFRLQPLRLDLREAVAAMAREVEAAWAQGREGGDTTLPAALQLELPTAPVFVEVDPGVVRTVLRNLLDNAGKYGGTAPVQLRLQRAGAWAQLTVSDGGTGLAAEQQALIFGKFYRVGNEWIRQTEGSGLGLYLVWALLQQSGGSVAVHSAGLGQGSTFVAKLPLATEAG